MGSRRRAVLVLFFVNGASFSSWLPRVPEVRDRLGLSLGALGTVLLGIGLGGLASSALGGVVVDRLGSRRVAVGASVTLAGGLVLIGLAPSAWLLALALVALSSVDALADIGMNVQAAAVQRDTGRSVIQRFHAAWSIGALVGAGLGTAAATLAVSLSTQLAVTGAAIVALVLGVAGALVDDVATPAEADRAGHGRVPAAILLAALALVVAVVEGTPGDWAAVFATDVHGASEGVAGSGFVAVASGMVAGRLAGDRATDHFGARRLFALALGVVAVGVALVVASPHVAVAIAGFGLAGCGISVLFPALYLQAATTPGVPPGLGVGVMTSGARLGFLLSPVVVGTISEATSLRVGLGSVIGAAIVGSAVLAAVAGRMAVSAAAGR